MILYWHDVAPRPTAQGARLRPDRPRRVRLGAPYDRIVDEARARGHPRADDGQRPGARLGDARRRQHRVPEPAALRPLRDAVGRQFGPRIELLVGLERAQPPAVPRPAVPARQAVRAADLPAAVPRRPQGPAPLRQPPRPRADGRDRAERQRAHHPAAAVPARGAVPEQALQEAPRAATSSTPTAGRTTPTRRAAARATSRAPRRRDDRLAVAARARARPGRAGPGDPPQTPDLPHGVRHPEQAGPGLRRLADPPGRVAGGGEQIAFRNSARARVLAVPDARRREQGRRYGGFESGLRFTGGRKKSPTAPSGCRWSRAAPAGACGCGGSCGRTTAASA